MKKENKRILNPLVEKVGGRFSTALGIHLSSLNPGEIFKWFLASVLFGARISEPIVIKTYRGFEKEGILSPEAILDTGWDGLVEVLDGGGYVRYDFKTATKLLEVNRVLADTYDGDLNLLHSKASDPRDLEGRLKALGRGIGEVTVNIFLREMRGVWEKARPLPSDLVVIAAKKLGLIPGNLKDKGLILQVLVNKWINEGMGMKDFPDLEAALLRLGKDYCRKNLCPRCPVTDCKGKEKG
ncbi:MAG: hypothetical protein QME44_05320 [Thermodesulfobacteriota bacterium]|nr:hypothetical protein [Thermodesulfobacteriota bacterium]